MTVSRVENGVQYEAPIGTDPADLGSWRDADGDALEPCLACEGRGVEEIDTHDGWIAVGGSCLGCGGSGLLRKGGP